MSFTLGKIASDMRKKSRRACLQDLSFCLSVCLSNLHFYLPYLSVFLPCPSLCLSVFLPARRSFSPVRLSVFLRSFFVYLYLHILSVCLSVYLSCPSVCLFGCAIGCPSVCLMLTDCPSFCLPVCLSYRLPSCRFVWLSDNLPPVHPPVCISCTFVCLSSYLLYSCLPIIY